MGTPVFAVPSLKALAGAGFDVAAAVTQPDKPRGRGKVMTPSPVKAAAVELGVEVLQPARVRDTAFLERLREIDPDVIAVVAYGKILPESVLDLPRLGCVNLHASLLPRYRGASPINHAIINGDAESGVSTMLMDKGMDTGPTLLEERVAIGPEDTAEDLAKTLSVVGAALLARTLKLLAGGEITPTPQDDSLATYAPMLRKTDGEIDWTRGAREIKNLTRGLYPWPGTYTRYSGRLLKVHGGRVLDECPSAGCEPGTVAEVGGDGIVVCCGEGAFEITELQPENKKRMKAGDFVKGYHVRPGDRFDKQP